MIPYISSTVFYIGPIPFRTWGTLVAIGYLVGAYVAARRARSKGLDEKAIWDLAFWLFIAAFVGARLFNVIFYQPMFYLAHPLAIIDPRQPGFAIEGGLIACALVFWYYVKKKKLDFMAYADTLIWGIPWGCGIGRIGCFLIHDHPGTLSNFVLAVKYPNGQVRNDLGLYLSLAGFIVGFIFLALDRKRHNPGFFFGMYIMLDSFTRIWLDFYRIADVTYLGLTPTQWVAIPLFFLGAWVVWSSEKQSKWGKAV
ncbi:MAG: prolipoprotein diacylglyceryl transferase [Patescibacteria group bacterium]